MFKEKRKICLVTGTRAEYGLSYPILRAIQDQDDLLLQLVVTGMHLLPEYGESIDLIKKDGFHINHIIKTLEKEETDGAVMADAIGRAIIGLTEYFKKEKPDILIAMTDLGHTLAVAVVGAHMNIPVAHVHGGDVSGSVDELVRHATTKLSHIHFPATKKSAERIIKMGEDSWRVHVVGAPGLDVLLHSELYDEQTIRKKYGLTQDKYFILIQHPVSTEEDQAGEQFKKTLQAIESFNIQTILIYPNADAGSKDIIKVIESYNKDYLKAYKNLPRKDYLSLLRCSSAQIGNSSSGIYEAPSFHIPVVDIGTRQSRREKAENVVCVDYDTDKIKSAIKFILEDNEFRQKLKNCLNPYGDGTAGKKIVQILTNLDLNDKLIAKQIMY